MIKIIRSLVDYIEEQGERIKKMNSEIGYLKGKISELENNLDEIYGKKNV